MKELKLSGIRCCSFWASASFSASQVDIELNLQKEPILVRINIIIIIIIICLSPSLCSKQESTSLHNTQLYSSFFTNSSIRFISLCFQSWEWDLNQTWVDLRSYQSCAKSHLHGFKPCSRSRNDCAFFFILNSLRISSTSPSYNKVRKVDVYVYIDNTDPHTYMPL